MGVSTRTVERRLTALQKKGFIRRLESCQRKGRAVREFDLSGLVEKLKQVTVENLKMRRVGSAALTASGDD
jgi:DNA-binding HxlR family transcriptional regulator